MGRRPVLDLDVEQRPPRKPTGGGKDGIIPRMSMALNIRPLEVDPENPHANDALGREGDCLMLADLIEETGGPFTLAVDAEWGDGKTVFVRMLGAHLAGRGFRCVSFSAWECDFHDEPLAPLIAEIGRQASEDAPKIKTRGNKLYGCFKKVVKVAHPAAGAVIESVEELAGGEETGGYDFMTPYEEYRSALKGFRGCLEIFSRKEGNGKSLVVFIDEVDRCRPDFAVKTLERVKHIFNVPSLIFVMAVNRRELASVVKSFYGCEDGEKYLEKFFDLVFHLRNERTLVGASLAEVGIGRFLARVKLATGYVSPNRHVEWFNGYLTSLSETFNFSLRVQQKLVRMLCIALRTVDYDFASRGIPAEGGHVDVYWQLVFRYPILCYFLALRVANPDLFHRSVESDTEEAFPWEEHIRFYLYKLGLEKTPNTENPINLHLLRPLKPDTDNACYRQDHSLAPLETVNSDERVLISLSLVALACLLTPSFTIHNLNDGNRFATQIEAIQKIMQVSMKDYASFREFLRAVDFAGKFYQRGS